MAEVLGLVLAGALAMFLIVSGVRRFSQVPAGEGSRKIVIVFEIVSTIVIWCILFYLTYGRLVT